MTLIINGFLMLQEGSNVLNIAAAFNMDETKKNAATNEREKRNILFFNFEAFL